MLAPGVCSVICNGRWRSRSAQEGQDTGHEAAPKGFEVRAWCGAGLVWLKFPFKGRLVHKSLKSRRAAVRLPRACLGAGLVVLLLRPT